MAVDLGLLTWNAGKSPSIGVLRDAVPDKLLFQEGRSKMGRRVSEAMDEVEDVSTELKRNPRSRTAGTDVAEKSGAIVVEGDVFLLKNGDVGSAGGHLRILLLQTGEELVVKAKADRGDGVSGEGISDRILLARNMLKSTVEF